MTTKLDRHHLLLLITVFILISFMLGCNEFMVVGNLSLIANSYHESLSNISWLIAAFAWTYALATPLLALFTSRWNKFYLLIGLLLIFLAGTILSSCAPTLSWLLTARIITAGVAGIIESLLSVIVYAITASPTQRSLAVAYIYTGFSIASVVGVPLGTLIAARWRWQDAFIMVAVITALTIAITAVALPKNLPGEGGNYRDQLKIFTDRQIWGGIFFEICAAATLYGYYTYIRPLIRQALHFSANQLSLWLLVIGIIDIAGSQTSGLIAAHHGFKTLRPVYLLNLVLLAAFAPLIHHQWSGLFLLFLLSFTVVLFNSPIQVFFLDRASQHYPTAVTLAATFSAVFYNVGIALSSLTAGQVLRFTGLSNLGWNSFAYCLLATILVFRLSRIAQDHC